MATGDKPVDKPPETTSGTVTSWIPITTAYPSQSGCASQYWRYSSNTMTAWDPGYGISVSDAQCLPKAATTWWDQDRLGANPNTVMSLGPISCPKAYYTATSSVKDSASTMLACCPSGYVFSDFMDPGKTGECYSEVDKGQLITFAYRDASQNWQLSTTAITAQTTIAGVPVNGWVFNGGSSFATPTPDSDGGWNSGARAALGIGVAMIIIGLASLAAGIWMMTRARRRTRDSGWEPLTKYAAALGVTDSAAAASSQHRPSMQSDIGVAPAATSFHSGGTTAYSGAPSRTSTPYSKTTTTHTLYDIHEGGGGGVPGRNFVSPAPSGLSGPTYSSASLASEPNEMPTQPSHQELPGAAYGGRQHHSPHPPHRRPTDPLPDNVYYVNGPHSVSKPDDTGRTYQSWRPPGAGAAGAGKWTWKSPWRFGG